LAKENLLDFVGDSGGSTGGGRGRSPLDWSPKKIFIARSKKKTYLQTPFCMSECTKTHLQQYIISKFSDGGPPDPPVQGEGREGEGRRRGRGKGREGARRRIGKGGDGREGTGEGRRGGMGVVGRGARHGLRPRQALGPPLVGDVDRVRLLLMYRLDEFGIGDINSSSRVCRPCCR